MERGLWVVHQGPAPSGHSFIPLATAQFKRTGEYWRGGRNALIGVCNMEFIGDLDGMGLLEDVPGRIRRDFIHEGVREETLGSAIQSGVSGGSSIWGGAAVQKPGLHPRPAASDDVPLNKTPWQFA